MAKDLTNPSPELFLKVMKRIRREERILAIKKITIFSTMLVASLAGLIPAVKMLVEELQSSGFVYFASLIFSDFEIVKDYWQSFSLAILGALPAVSIALCFAVLLILLQSVKALSKNIKIVSNIKHLAIR